MVGWTELRIVCKEETDLLFFEFFDRDIVEQRHFAISLRRVVLLALVLLDVFAAIVHFQTRILRVQHTFDLCELTCLVCLCHLIIK